MTDTTQKTLFIAARKDAKSAARTKVALEQKVCYNGGEMISRAGLIEKLVAKGYKVEIVKGERRFLGLGGVFLDVKAIGKTAMDYAEHIQTLA